MSLAGSRATLSDATKELMARWDQTRQFWRDAKAQQFAEAYLDPLPDQVTTALRVMEDLERLLSKIHADCE